MLNAPNSSVLVQPYGTAIQGNYSAPLPGGNLIYAPNSNIYIAGNGNYPTAADSYSPSNALFPPSQDASAYQNAYPPTSSAYPPAIPPQTPVASNQKASIWGDPHVDTANGGKYNFQQIGTYNILQDTGLNLNARLEGTGTPGQPTYIKEAGLTLGDRHLDVKTDGTATLGSGPNAIVIQDGQTIQMADGSSIAKHGPIITVDTPEYKINIDSSNPDKGKVPHLNIDVHSKVNGVMSDGAAPTGLLGESFNAGTQAQTTPALDTSAYQRAGLFDNSSNAATQALAAQQLTNAGGQIVTPPSPVPNPGLPTNVAALGQVMTILSYLVQMMLQIMGQSSNGNVAA